MREFLSSRKKYKIIHECMKRFRLDTVIETGTYRAGMVMALHDRVSKIISIELDEKLFSAAKIKCKDFRNVELYLGDSCHWLKQILPQITKPCLFWLDAHYCKGGSRTEVDSPIQIELDEINEHPVKNHVILIDDIRLMNEDFAPGYISPNKIKQTMSNYKNFNIRNDIMKIWN
jgi:hypothetical protein